MRQKFISLVLSVLVLTMASNVFADLYKVEGVDGNGLSVSGEVITDSSSEQIQGYVFKEPHDGKYSNDIYFTGVWLSRNKIEGYSEKGQQFILTSYQSINGKTDIEQKIIAIRYLLAYFEKALIYYPDHVGFVAKIKNYINRFSHKSTLNSIISDKYYHQLENDIPVAAAYYRIYMDLPNRETSQNEIKSFLNDDMFSSSETSRVVIMSTIKLLKAHLETFENASKD